MTSSETSQLLESYDAKVSRNNASTNGLSVSFAAVCIVDVFGVFPLVTTPKAIIQCGKLTHKYT